MRIGKQHIRRSTIDEKYSVTEDGLVWSGPLPLEPINGTGVNLHGKRVKISYLVARAFVPNQECRKYVRHKDGDPTNNSADNLEWSDQDEKKRPGRPPIQRWIKAYHDDGGLAGCWGDVAEAAAETGAVPAHIRECLYGRRKTAGGLIWTYA